MLPHVASHRTVSAPCCKQCCYNKQMPSTNLEAYQRGIVLKCLEFVQGIQMCRAERLVGRAGVARSAEAYTVTGNGVTPRSGKPVLEPSQWDGGFVSTPSQLYRAPAQAALPMAPNRLRLFSGTANPVSPEQHGHGPSCCRCTCDCRFLLRDEA